MVTLPLINVRIVEVGKSDEVQNLRLKVWLLAEQPIDSRFSRTKITIAAITSTLDEAVRK